MRGSKILSILLLSLMMLSILLFFSEEVEAQTTDYILIRNAPNGGGINLCEPFNYMTLPVGYVTTFYGAEYNNSVGYIGDVPATSTWDSSDTSIVSTTSPGNSSTITCSNTNWGTATITLDDGSGHTNTTQVTVLQPAMDYILIRDVPGGGGVNLCDPGNYPTYSLGANGTFWGAAYNITAGFLGDLPSTVLWSSNDTNIVTVTTPDNPTFYQCSWINEGSVWITLNDGMGLQNTTRVTVSSIPPYAVDYIIIRDTSGGWGNWVGDETYLLGETYTFYAAGYNSSQGYIGDVSVNWSSSDPNVGNVTTPGSSTTFDTIGGGTCTVSADYGGGITNSTGILRIVTIDEIMIKDAPDGGGYPVFIETYWVGQNDTFWAAGHNDTYGYICDLEVNWSSNDTNVGTITSYGIWANFEAVGAGHCNIFIDYESLSNSTLDIEVLPVYMDYITIRDSPGGIGSIVDDMTYKEGESDIFYAASYNSAFGYMGDVSVNWTSDNPSVGNVTTPGFSTSFNAQGPGTCIVTADYGGGITDETGVLTVIAIDNIMIRDAPNNGGMEVGNMFFNSYANDTFWAASYNDTYGYQGDVISEWTSSNTSVAVVTTPGYLTSFDSVSHGNCIVTANYNGITDDTGILTISNYTVDYILIRDAPGGGGINLCDPANYQTYLVGATDIYYGAMYNNVLGYLCDVPYDSYWNTSDINVVTVTWQGTSTTITCNDTNAGTVVITLWAMGRSNTTTITVYNWTVDYISIRDAPGESGNMVGDRTYCVWEIDTFYAIGFNYTQGYVMDVNASWSSSEISVGSVTTPGMSTTFSAQWVPVDSTCQVTATYNSLSNTTGTLTVLTPRTDYVQIRSADGGGGGIITTISYNKGDTDTYFGAAYNDTVDFIGSVPQSSTWTSSDITIVDVTSPGNSSTITCSNTNGGTVIVTLNDGLGHTNFSTVTVLNWTVDYILIRDAPSGGGKDLTDPANYPTYGVGHVTTYYGAMYNNTAGYIADVASTATWTSDNTNLVEVTSPGVSSTITCSNTNHGLVIITLEEELMGKSATTQITVLEPTIDYITIMDAPNGIGNIVGNMLYMLGVEDDFYAAAFNNTAEYLYDVSVEWSSSDTSVGTVTTPGAQTNFSAVGIGTCVVTAQYSSIITDSTGTLTVDLPTNITVGQCPGAYFTSIQEAINHASEGDTIYVCSGTYNEHLTIDKPITLMGEDMATTIIDGDDYGKVIFVSGDDVSISGLTIQNGEYGIYLDETDTTSITYNKIRGYDYGIYCYKTIDGYIAYNIITDGQYGIVTFEAYNDAIRYNTISFNTEYGAKDYNSQLRNCFNWNYFFKNKIAYYYDPDTELATLEFDGNILEDNYIGVKVENASTISITNNTASGNEYGIYLVNASPEIANNEISDSDYGIYAEQSSPSISNNIISEISNYGIYAQSGDSLKIINNTLLDAQMIFIDSIIKELWLKESNITKINTTIEESHLDDTSTLEIEWTLHIQVTDDEGKPIEGATVLIYDAYDTLVSAHFTDSEGWIQSIPIIETKQSSTSTVVYNPYHIMVVKDSLTKTEAVTIQEDTDIVISLESEEVVIKPTKAEFPYGLLILIGFIGAISVGCIAIEIMKYGLITLFLPLYSRIKKEKLLDQPTRERIYGYIIG
ncbi:MAG: right-handed parallel beta-helix repeat-containing protein, partial [Thermoplasmata archaeon]